MRRYAKLLIVFQLVGFLNFATDVSGADISPEITRAVKRGVAFTLKSGHSGGEASLAGYAVINGNEKPDSPFVKNILKRISGKIKNGKYKASGHIYEAGVDMMLLEAADPLSYRTEMEAIVQYIISQQKDGGHWFYPDQPDTGGDTSITQYALLGLWSATRSGVDVPKDVWDRAAGWHVRTQLQDGSFTYHPPGAKSIALHSMTSAGMGSLLICRLHLYPDAKAQEKRKNRPPEPPPKFGVLKKTDLDKEAKEAEKAANTSYKPKTGLGAINGSVARATGWYNQKFTVTDPIIDWRFYYFYAMERMASLAGQQSYGGHDWYQEVADFLVKAQKEDGSWGDHTGIQHNTSFAILFLTRATGKKIGAALGPRFGAGDMEGVRDLANVKDFSLLEMKNGKLVKKEKLGKLDDLLNELNKPRLDDIGSVTDTIVNLVNLGERETLVGKRDLLLKLSKDPRPEARRIALWALGRTSDFDDLTFFMKSLEDPNIDVVVEANNALCWINRNPQGVGLPNSPLKGIPENASDEQRRKAMEKWQADVRKRWKAWYIKIRPYEERNDLQEESGR